MLKNLSLGLIFNYYLYYLSRKLTKFKSFVEFPILLFFVKTFLLTGGRLAELFGGKWLFGGGVFITAVFTLLTPLVNLPVDNQLLNLFFIYI